MADRRTVSEYYTQMAKELIDTEQKSPEQVFACIVRAHREAERIASEISETLAFEPEELNAGDIRELLEKMNKLKMHLEIMETGYIEYIAMV
jgi:hypothetical protein